MTTNETPAVEGLFTQGPSGARLIGSRCATCSTPYFPRSGICHHPDCEHSDMQDAEFAGPGTLWSFSVQSYPPPPPARYDDPYEPYAVGVVDLDDGLRVVGRMQVEDPTTLTVGARVDLVVGPLCHEPDGSTLVSWMFRPV
jgi:uncharacterized OB-fold protein